MLKVAGWGFVQGCLLEDDFKAKGLEPLDGSVHRSVAVLAVEEILP